MPGKEEMLAFYQSGQDGEAGPGQPLLTPQGVDAGERIPRTQNKPAFYLQVPLQTLSKVLGESEWLSGGGLLGVRRD